MAENNSYITNNPFGLNVAIPHKTVQDVQKVVQQEIANITVNPFINYLDENDKVFSGEVAKEIRKYQSQMYTLGQVMRDGQARRTFNIKI